MRPYTGKNDIDRLYVLEKEERGHTNTEEMQKFNDSKNIQKRAKINYGGQQQKN